jgi:hypothetical protein
MEIPRQSSLASRHSSSGASGRVSSTGSASASDAPKRHTSTGARSSTPNNNNNTPSSVAQAASSLALLLREDKMLTKLDMHVGSGDEAAFSYAAALLESEDSKNHQQRAEEALGEVDRKLALVESLGERVSRTSPEAVAGSLLRLHGYSIEEESSGEGEGGAKARSAPTSGTTTTLMATRERCDRLKRQGEVLDGVAGRVETSLNRGLNRMEKATKRLSRVLQLSATLKMILRLQFEASKLVGFYLDDLRDLTRAAASVAVIEDLLSKPELKDGPKIDVVEAVRPEARKTGAAVRKAAADLLAKHQVASMSNSSSSVIQLGATLQVYFHLGELPQAAWSAVNHAVNAAEKVSNEFWSPTTLSNLTESATTEAKLASGSGKKLSDASLQRAIKAKLKELRAEAAGRWARGITEASLQVWNLHQVLSRKSDPVTRKPFVDVVAESAIPEKYEQYRPPGQTKEDFSIFLLYWERLCYKMGDRLKHILEYENGKFAPDASSLYPAVRAASIHMLTSLSDAMQVGLSSATLDDTNSSSSSGVLGGSAALGDSFLQWTTSADITQGAGPTLSSADTWTVTKNTGSEASGADGYKSSGNAVSISGVFNSPHWVSLQGNHASSKGLFRLQRAFLEASRDRLCAPLQFMFQENVTVDDAGNAISHLPLLPSRYDIQKLDANIRQELSLADPREGGGDLSAVTMISENVTGMISQFCEQANNAVSNAGEDACLDPKDGSPTEALLHDLKVAKIMNAMAESLRAAPEKVFLEPYRPAVTAKLEEAADMCEQALKTGLQEIDNFIHANILGPLCRALNRRVAATIGRMHYGSYMQESGGGLDNDGPSFVQKYINDMYEDLGNDHLSKLPKKYAAVVASTVATFSIYTFVSNVSLMRPLAESTKLHITQDLADFELSLEQLMVKGGQSKHLNEIANGKPYVELRAVRQMLFWTGLEDSSKPAASIAKTMSRETWVRQVRPSTVFHYLFSFAPSLLSSPHHFKRVRVDEYVGTLVTLDGEVEEGEAGSWMTTMACCDSYRQRESAQQGAGDGDARVANILMTLGPELLRRRRP